MRISIRKVGKVLTKKVQLKNQERKPRIVSIEAK